MPEGAVLEVVKTIANVEGTDPLELDDVLEDHVPTDALRLLIGHDDRAWRLTFDFRSRRVTVRGDGWILVDGERANQWRSGDGDDDGDGGCRTSVGECSLTSGP